MEQLGGGAKPPVDRVATAFPTVDALSYRAIVLSTTMYTPPQQANAGVHMPGGATGRRERGNSSPMRPEDPRVRTPGNPT